MGLGVENVFIYLIIRIAELEDEIQNPVRDTIQNPFEDARQKPVEKAVNMVQIKNDDVDSIVKVWYISLRLLKTQQNL